MVLKCPIWRDIFNCPKVFGASSGKDNQSNMLLKESILGLFKRIPFVVREVIIPFE